MLHLWKSRIQRLAGFMALSAIFLGVVFFLPGHSVTLAYPYPPADATEPPATEPPPTDPPATEVPYPPPDDHPTAEPPPPPAPPADDKPEATAEPTSVAGTPVPDQPGQPGHPGQPVVTETHSNLPPHLKSRTSDPIVSDSYVVQPGDTLFRIAVRSGITLDALLAANGLRTATIQPGQALIIPAAGRSPAAPAAPPPGGAYAIQGGDTLYQLARRYGVSVQALIAANGLRTTTIRVGQTLIIPTVLPSATPRPAAPSANPHAYVVQGGDTLFQIARRYGVTVQALMAANHLTGAVIRPEQNLVIP
jgi:LysM repeat protein